MKTIQIAIDGPASSGKSTVAKIIAKDFGLYLFGYRCYVSCCHLHRFEHQIVQKSLHDFLNYWNNIRLALVVLKQENSLFLLEMSM